MFHEFELFVKTITNPSSQLSYVYSTNRFIFCFTSWLIHCQKGMSFQEQVKGKILLVLMGTTQSLQLQKSSAFRLYFYGFSFTVSQLNFYLIYSIYLSGEKCAGCICFSPPPPPPPPPGQGKRGQQSVGALTHFRQKYKTFINKYMLIFRRTKEAGKGS